MPGGTGGRGKWYQSEAQGFQKPPDVFHILWKMSRNHAVLRKSSLQQATVQYTLVKNILFQMWCEEVVADGYTEIQ